MSNERFDKRIKQQLESVTSPYQARAWDRFRKRLPVVGFWPWLAQYGGWVLSGLMLGGWLMTLYTLNQHQLVMARLGETRALPAQPNQELPVAKPAATAPVNRVDTVFIVKRTIVEHRHYYTPSNQGALDRDPLPVDSPLEVSGGPNNRLRQPVRFSRLTGITRPDHQANGELSNLSITRRETIKSVKNPSEKVLLRSAGLPPTLDSNQVVGAPFTNSSESREAHKPQPVRPDSISQSVSKPDPATLNPIKDIEQPKEPGQPARQSHPPFRLSLLKPRIGIEMIAARHGIGAGPSIELFPGENLGLSLGLQASQLRAENHRGLPEFNTATGQEFIHQYRAFLPGQYDKIEDISIQTAVISLPVNLKYYIPLHRNWSLLVQTGTSFDVAAYQQVRYESYFMGDEQHNSFEMKAEHRLFHNLMFGTGVQFRSARFSAQLTPYYLYDFRPIMNTPTGSNFGLKASVWIDVLK